MKILHFVFAPVKQTGDELPDGRVFFHQKNYPIMPTALRLTARPTSLKGKSSASRTQCLSITDRRGYLERLKEFQKVSLRRLLNFCYKKGLLAYSGEEKKSFS